MLKHKLLGGSQAAKQLKPKQRRKSSITAYQDMKSYQAPRIENVITLPEPLCDLVSSLGDDQTLVRRKEATAGRYGTGRRLWEDL